MKPIKTIAGKVLLYFYLLQRTDTAKLFDLVLNFHMRNFSGRKETSPVLGKEQDAVIKNLLKLTGNANDLYNGLRYLADKAFIEMKYTPSRTCDHFSLFRVLPDGVDVIEGILRGEKEKQEFYTTFNIKLTDKTDIESLLGKQLGGLVSM